MILYQFGVVLYLAFIFPKIIWECLTKGKYRKSFKARLGFQSIDLKKNQKVIWLHAVSVGEVKALMPLLPLIRVKFPESFILITTTTETGYAEANRTLQDINHVTFLPLDLPLIISSFVQRIKPHLFILMEGDFWPNLLHAIKKSGATIIATNGKISERSFRRFLKFKRFSKRLFQTIDLYCVQDEIYAKRFKDLGAHNVQITGNIKFDIPAYKMPENEKKAFKQELGISKTNRVLVIGSTHASEEKLLLSALSWKDDPHLKIVIVPRHPERFKNVENLIEELKVPYLTYSKRSKLTGKEKIILIDAMGILSKCYQLADLAIVGGSFVKNVGGHDIFEPIRFGVPAFFGPYMHQQKELVKHLLKSGAGMQVNLNELGSILSGLYQNPRLREELIQKGNLLRKTIEGSSLLTWNKMQTVLADK